MKYAKIFFVWFMLSFIFSMTVMLVLSSPTTWQACAMAFFGTAAFVYTAVENQYYLRGGSV